MITEIQSLRDKVVACQKCSDLVKTRTQVVFGAGDPNSMLVFVGEAPGEEEDARGVPFVGRAGKLLDKLLHEVGFQRNHIWITNIVKCRPTTTSADGKLNNRPPRMSEIKSCKSWLDQELSIISPQIIVCVGGPSASLIIHKGFKITEERGIWFTDSQYAPFCMAIYHPAYVLRLKGKDYDEALELLANDIKELKRKFIEIRGLSQKI